MPSRIEYGLRRENPLAVEEIQLSAVGVGIRGPQDPRLVQPSGVVVLVTERVDAVVALIRTNVHARAGVVHAGVDGSQASLPPQLLSGRRIGRELRVAVGLRHVCLAGARRRRRRRAAAADHAGPDEPVVRVSLPSALHPAAEEAHRRQDDHGYGPHGNSRRGACREPMRAGRHGRLALRVRPVRRGHENRLDRHGSVGRNRRDGEGWRWRVGARL